MTPRTDAGNDWPPSRHVIEAEARRDALTELRAAVEGLPLVSATPKGRFRCSWHVDRAAVLALFDAVLSEPTS